MLGGWYTTTRSHSSDAPLNKSARGAALLEKFDVPSAHDLIGCWPAGPPAAPSPGRIAPSRRLAAAPSAEPRGSRATPQAARHKLPLCRSLPGRGATLAVMLKTNTALGRSVGYRGRLRLASPWVASVTRTSLSATAVIQLRLRRSSTTRDRSRHRSRGVPHFPKHVATTRRTALRLHSRSAAAVGCRPGGRPGTRPGGHLSF